MEQLNPQQLIEINKEIKAVLDKYNVTLQVTQGIVYVPVAPKEEVVKEAEIVSPYNQDEPLKEN